MTWHRLGPLSVFLYLPPFLALGSGECRSSDLRSLVPCRGSP